MIILQFNATALKADNKQSMSLSASGSLVNLLRELIDELKCYCYLFFMIYIIKFNITLQCNPSNSLTSRLAKVKCPACTGGFHER